MIYNTEGYVMRQIYLRSYRQDYRRDHLGNNVAVWNATEDSIVQRTFYYASGLPMSCSTGQSTQSRKYNGKEYVEDHGFDVYDYGFRGYYATIGRFTSIDPLAEQTPWQSPYVYANNNFINNIDYWGLAAISFSQPPTYSCIFIDNNGVMLGGIDDGDWGIYLVEDDNWTLSDGKDGLTKVGEMFHSFEFYITHFLVFGAGGWKAPGWYYGQNNIRVTLSGGIAIGKLNNQSSSNRKKDKKSSKINIGIDVMSFILADFSYTFNEKILDWDNLSFTNWLFKDHALTITQGIAFTPIGEINHSFKVDALNDMKYIRGTDQTNITNVFAIFSNLIDANGNFSISKSETLFISFTISINGNIYYNGNK